MSSEFSIDGFAIASADGMIAGPDGVMPKSLQFEADKRFFIEALENVDLVVHGRHSHEGQPKSPLRRRFWMTRSVTGLELRTGETRQWNWNPEGIELEEACRSIGMTRGEIAILGGPKVYSLFLSAYRAFYLCRAERVLIPGGTPVFDEIGEGRSVEQVLRDSGLSPQPAQRAGRRAGRDAHTLGAALSQQETSLPMPDYAARDRVLQRMALDRLVTHDYVDIAEGHLEHAASLARPGRYLIEGMTIEAPAGVYHPHPDSTSMMFIRNILALQGRAPQRALEVGCGSGVVAMLLARRFGADTLATDISAAAVETTIHNAEHNAVPLRARQADMFDGTEERDFDLVVFNTPLVDMAPTIEGEGGVLCDPGGVLLDRFAHRVGDYLARDGAALFSLSSNSAYERLDDVGLALQTVGIEMIGNGFWRAIVGARRRP